MDLLQVALQAGDGREHPGGKGLVGDLQVDQQVIGQGFRAFDPLSVRVRGGPVHQHPLHQCIAPGQLELGVQRLALLMGATLAQGDGRLFAGVLIRRFGERADDQQAAQRQAMVTCQLCQAQDPGQGVQCGGQRDAKLGEAVLAVPQQRFKIGPGLGLAVIVERGLHRVQVTQEVRFVLVCAQPAQQCLVATELVHRGEVERVGDGAEVELARRAADLVKGGRPDAKQLHRPAIALQRRPPHSVGRSETLQRLAGTLGILHLLLNGIDAADQHRFIDCGPAQQWQQVRFA
ncbi:hypothetical protein D3C79_651670 [compost metagenome]